MINIKTFKNLNLEEKDDARSLIKEIFYLSSSIKTFDSEDRKQSFFMKWCGNYLEKYPEFFYLAFSEDQQLLGYLCGSINSRECLEVLNVPGMSLFSDCFDEFPAHLHINFHPDARGKGLGTILVNHFIKDCKKLNIGGLHLITSPDAKNVSFYKRLNFIKEIVRFQNEKELLFMGQRLNDSVL